jgi:hypothetical protein
MSRIRSIKPEFFEDEDLAKTSAAARLLYVAVWVLADREGRFGWRPAWIKSRSFPYDSKLDIGRPLDELLAGGFLLKYEVGGKVYGCVPTWRRHQLPGRDEPPSEIPEPTGAMTEYDPPPNQTIRARLYARDSYHCRYCDRDMTHDVRARCLDHVIPYSQGGTNRELNLVTCCKPCNAKKGDRTTESAGMVNPDGFGERYPVNGVLTVGQRGADKDREGERDIGNGNGDGSGDHAADAAAPSRFEEFWAAYPKKRDKGHAEKAFKALRVSDGLLSIMLSALEHQCRMTDWTKDGGKFIPLAATWLHGHRWDDEIGMGTDPERDRKLGPAYTPGDWWLSCQHSPKCETGPMHRQREAIDSMKGK